MRKAYISDIIASIIVFLAGVIVVFFYATQGLALINSPDIKAKQIANLIELAKIKQGFMEIHYPLGNVFIQIQCCDKKCKQLCISYLGGSEEKVDISGIDVYVIKGSTSISAIPIQKSSLICYGGLNIYHWGNSIYLQCGP